MTFAIAGGAVMGIAHLNESLLERITRKLRAGWKRLVDILNQPGVPRLKNYRSRYGAIPFHVAFIAPMQYHRTCHTFSKKSSSAGYDR